MRKRCAIGIAVAAAGVMALGAQTATARGDSPNIVVVMTDDQRADTLGAMPNVEALGGTTYARHYAVQPLCCPSRASFLTGQYPHAHGITTNSPAEDEARAVELGALPTWLEAAGYRTALAGKYLNDYPWSAPYVPPGWGEWFARIRSTSGARGGEYFDGSQVEHRPEHDTEVLTEWALDFIAESPAPFFLTIAPQVPHLARTGERPRNPMPEPLPEDVGAFAGERAPGRAGRRERVRDKAWFLRAEPRYRNRLANRYWQRQLEAIQGVDRMVGAIRAELEQRGEWANTVLMFTSDNGFMLGEHRLWGKDVPYEEAARVPLVVAGPGFAERSVRTPTANVDLPLTIARLAGAEPTIEQGGRALWNPRRRLLLEGRGAALDGPHRWHAAVTRRWSFIDWRGAGRELYGLRGDPGQLHALRKHRRVKARLAWWIERQAP